ncbi:MAG: type II secretion system F family protein, partial [Candidatus Nomurabacteria bacterium]|nr:type II secretion system F family protein [Candidatus Nomurabacteria bacterium]
MITFNYTARDTASNKIVKSAVQAQSEHEAAKLLMAQGIVPLNLTPESGKAGFLTRLTNRISTKQRVIFTRQLATLINAGLPIGQSLATVEDQTDSKPLKQIVGTVSSDVEGGSTMADAFAKYPKTFNQVFIALVRAGETSGTLDKSLERLADQEEHDADIMSKIRGAMAYPIIVLVVIIGVMAFLLLTVMPQVKQLYASMNKPLPFLTQIMVNLADFFVKFWWVVLLVLVGLVFLFFRWRATTGGRRSLDLFKLNVPLFKTMFRKLYMSRFARTAQTLLESGVPMLEMLKISSQAVNNMIIAEEISRASEKVKGGKPLSVALTGQDYILPFVPQMINIGEQ